MALFAVVAAVGGRAALAAPPPIPYSHSVYLAEIARIVAPLAVAKGDDATKIGDELVALQAGITSNVDRDTNGGDEVKALEPFVTGTNPDAQLVAAMTIARLHSLSTEGALERMLNNPNAAVRYWAIKGLREITNLVNTNPGNAIAALKKQFAQEKSPLLKKEIIRSLGELGDVLDICEIIDSITAAMVTTAPDQDTLEILSIGFSKVNAILTKTGALTKPADAQKATKVAKTASAASSVVAQHLYAKSTALKPTETLPDGYEANVLAVINNAMQVLNSASGKSEFAAVPAGSTPDAVKLNMDNVGGSPSLGGGQVQKVFTGVPIPPTIKPAK